MHIESGTTAWWRNRHLLFIVLFLGCGGWFARDGYYSWPAENKKWAAEAMNIPPGEFQVNPKVTYSAVQKFGQEKKDARFSLNELISRFGEPTLVRNNEIWFVGPDAYLKLGQTQQLDVQIAGHKMFELWSQRILALILAILAVLVFIKMIWVMRTRVVLDESGLRYNRKHITWEEMNNLRGDDYARKGWADLEYTSNGVKRTFRLDSYHIDKFDEIVAGICERKGFPSPLTAAAQGSAEPSASETRDPGR